MVLEPHDDKVVIKSLSQPENKAGIEYHDSSKERPLEGTVVAVGENCKFYAVGDKVAYTRFNINEVKLAGETFFVMKEEQILTGIKEA